MLHHACASKYSGAHPLDHTSSTFSHPGQADLVSKRPADMARVRSTQPERKEQEWNSFLLVIGPERTATITFGCWSGDGALRRQMKMSRKEKMLVPIGSSRTGAVVPKATASRIGIRILKCIVA